jgi:hypothetical protein
MNDTLTEYSNKLRTIVDIVHKNVIVQIKLDDLKEEPKKFLYTLLFKINNGLCTASLLIINIRGSGYVTDSIFILLRTLLSDVLTLHYLLFKSKGSDDEFKLLIDSLYFDHINFTINTSLPAFVKLYKEDQTTLKTKVEELKVAKKEFFDSNGKPKSHLKSLTSIYGMIKEIGSQTSKITQLDYFTIGAEHYDIFSKYEHLGDLTFHMIHRTFDATREQEVLTNIYHAVNVILHYQKIALQGFYEKESETFKAFDKLRMDIGQFKLIV